MVATRSQARAAASPTPAHPPDVDGVKVSPGVKTTRQSGTTQRSQPPDGATAGLFNGSDEVNEAPKRKSTAASKGMATATKARSATGTGMGKREASPVRPFTPEVTQRQSKTILDLPAELRNNIWAMLVVQTSLVNVSPTRPFVKEPALLAVNRQIRSEAMSIWYAEHDFRIMGSSPAVRFLRSRNDQQLRSIRALCITSEKSDQMKKEPRAWIKHLQAKLQTLMREFEGRGLRRWALKFQVMDGGEIKWIDGDVVQGVGVLGAPDKGEKIRCGPRKSEEVAGAGSF